MFGMDMTSIFKLVTPQLKKAMNEDKIESYILSFDDKGEFIASPFKFNAFKVLKQLHEENKELKEKLKMYTRDEI